MPFEGADARNTKHDMLTSSVSETVFSKLYFHHIPRQPLHLAILTPSVVIRHDENFQGNVNAPKHDPYCSQPGPMNETEDYHNHC